MKNYILKIFTLTIFTFSNPIFAQDQTVSIQQKNVEINSVSGGQLLQFPAAICNLRNLESLNLTGHNFPEIPDCISMNSGTLRILRLGKNGITKVSPLLTQLKFLENLDLNGNKITLNASDDWSGLYKVNNIDLSNNPITTLPDSLGQLKSLETLSLANTQITAIPDSFSNLTWLRNVNLSNTKLTITPKAFSAWVNLEKLNITGVNFSAAEKNVILAIFKGRNVEITPAP